MKITGLSHATMIPVGARVARAYWVLAEHYHAGNEHPSQEAAIRAGIARYRAAEVKHRAFHGADQYPDRYLPLPQAFTVDLRFDWEFPPDALCADGRPAVASGMDEPVQRYRYESIADAEAHADRLAKYAPAHA